jgi:hypothetical protein
MPSLPPVGRTVGPEIREAIQTAAKRTGVSFDFLVKQAEAESGFDPNAKAATSSATGLYQFIDSTWLSMVRQFGAKYGIPEAAEAVTQGPSGAPRIGDPDMRARVLELRKDPRLAAAMAAEFTKANQEHLRASLGREPSATDLYMAHFLGPQGATRFLRARAQNGEQSAAETMPEAAAANRAVFQAADGRPRSLNEVYARFAKRFEAIPTGQASPDIVEAVARTERGSMRSQALFAAMQTRVQALQGISAQGLQPLTVATLAALDDRQGRTLAGRVGKRGLL